MAVRWSRVALPAALMPALAVTLTANVGAIVWSVCRSFTASRRFSDYGFIGRKQSDRLFSDDAATVTLKNMVRLGAGSPVGDRRRDRQRYRRDQGRPLTKSSEPAAGSRKAAADGLAIIRCTFSLLRGLGGRLVDFTTVPGIVQT